MNKEYKYGFIHYWNYFLTNFSIANKRMFEYKANLINVIIVHIARIFLFLLFGYTFVMQYSSITNWDYNTVLIFIFSLTTVYLFFAHIFYAFKYLDRDIIEGKLNILLIKPGNPILNYICKLEISVLFFIIDILFYFILLIYYGSFNLFNIILAIPIMILIAIAHLSIFFYLDSLAFFTLKFSATSKQLFKAELSSRLLSYFPGQLFQKEPVKFFISLFPMYYISTLVVPIIQYGYVDNWWLYLIIIFCISFIFTIGIIINWHYGLKKYDAYN